MLEPPKEKIPATSSFDLYLIWVYILQTISVPESAKEIKISYML
jgi:hypothetical protein